MLVSQSVLCNGDGGWDIMVILDQLNAMTRVPVERSRPHNEAFLRFNTFAAPGSCEGVRNGIISNPHVEKLLMLRHVELNPFEFCRFALHLA